MKNLTLTPYRAGAKVWVSIREQSEHDPRAIAGMLFAERAQYYCWGDRTDDGRVILEGMVHASHLLAFFRDLQALHKLRHDVLVSFQSVDCP